MDPSWRRRSLVRASQKVATTATASSSDNEGVFVSPEAENQTDTVDRVSGEIKEELGCLVVAAFLGTCRADS